MFKNNRKRYRLGLPELNGYPISKIIIPLSWNYFSYEIIKFWGIYGA